MSKQKSTLTILYLSGETYTIDGVKDHLLIDVYGGGTYLHVDSYNHKRKVDMTQRIPSEDIELYIVREKGGKRIEAVRLHRQKGNNGQRVYLDI